MIFAVQKTKSGGYILAGDTEFSLDLPGDAWLIKTDKEGNVE